MMTSESELPETENKATTFSFIHNQRLAMLAWGLALPIGWLVGWTVGAVIAYNNYIPHEAIPQNRIQAFRETALATGGWQGGLLGVLIGLIIAYTITLLSLRSAIHTEVSSLTA
jgi:hypothetical protein